MSASVGRTIALTWGGAAIAGVREKGVALNGEPVDVSDDDSAGWRELLDVAGENTVDISISGVTKDGALKEDWFAGNRTQAVTITYPDGGVLSGDFFLVNHNDTGPYKDAATFEASLQSTGAVDYAAPSSGA